MRKLLPFHRDCHFLAQFVRGALGPQLRPHSRERFLRIERARDGVVRTEIKSQGAIGRFVGDQQDYANVLRRGCAFPFRQHFTAGRAGNTLIHDQQRRVGLARGGQAFRVGRKHLDVVARGLQKLHEDFSRTLVSIQQQDFFV